MSIEELVNKLDELKEEFKNEVEKVNLEDDLNEIRVKYLSKKGIISKMNSFMREVDDKKAFGQKLNEVKATVENTLEEKTKLINEEKIKIKKIGDKIDVTAPSKKINYAHQNILLKTAREVEKVFEEMGFEIAQGYEVETDFYNFEALNLGVDHPARDMQDTFYINPQLLLRTHTSNSQARTLSANDNKSFKIITPGKVYRRDDDDATHSHQFMQIEGLVVINKNEGIYASLRELKTTLTIFVNRFLERDDITLRMRPSYFPFTEPSVEVDITCTHCSGNGCSFCKQSGWIEILGAGVTHKNVLSNSGYDPEQFSAYAFGIGVERVALLKHDISDIRDIYTNDYRVLKQF